MPSKRRITKKEIGVIAIFWCAALTPLSVFADSKTDYWEFSGYLSSVSANGGSINSNINGSLNMTRHDGKFSYSLDAGIQRFSERVLVRRDTGFEPTADDEIPVVDPDGLRYTVRNLPGPSNIRVGIKYRQKESLFYMTDIGQRTDRSSYDTDTESLVVDAGLGYRSVKQVLAADMSEGIATVAFSYRNAIGRRSELTTTALYDHGNDFQYSNVKFGLHFWMTDNLAIALVNETQRYSAGLIWPQYIESGSTSITSFNLVFKNGTL